jgi:two-component system OmpR family sensor kinase
MSSPAAPPEWICAPQRRLFHIFPAGGPMCSLRRALLLWLVPLFLAVGLGSALFSYWGFSRMASVFMDDQMQQLAQAVAGSRTLAAAPVPAPEKIHTSGNFVTQVYGADGALLASSLPQLRAGLQPTAGFADVQADGATWRVYSTQASGAEGRRVQVLQSGSFRSRLAAERALAAAAPVLILLPLAIAILWGLARAMSLAVQDIGRQAALQDAHSIAELPLARVPQEIQPLVVSFNSLLTRLRDAFADQRRFVQDAAHELRTPITALALQMENVRGDLPPGACAESFAQLEAGLRRAQRLVEQLLKLSRQQAPFVEEARDLDLRAQLHESINSLIALADRRRIDLGFIDLTEGQPGATWRCAAGDLRSVVDNLVENALRYTPGGGVVDVRLLPAGVVEIVDTGPGIPPELLDRVFDRFYRVAGGDSRGSGLGLAIAQAAAQRCGLRISLRNRPDAHGLVARVEPGEGRHAALTSSSESAQRQLNLPAYSDITVDAKAGNDRTVPTH